MKRLLIAIMALALSACSTTDVVSTPALGSPPLCSAGAQLGAVTVIPLTRWRPDQKEKEARAEIGRKAMEAAFMSTPCARSVKVLAPAPDSEAGAKLEQAKAEGANTAVLIRMDELGPILIISIPALWSTWSDIKFNFEAIDLASGQTRLKVDHHRKVGGAFQVRGVGPLQAEMETALHELITGPQPK